jgi:hypothetical protein
MAGGGVMMTRAAAKVAEAEMDVQRLRARTAARGAAARGVGVLDVMRTHRHARGERCAAGAAMCGEDAASSLWG